MQPSVVNVLDVYLRASESDIVSGLSWYTGANLLINEVDPDMPERAAGMIAALSPLNGWRNNVYQATAFYRNGEPRGLGRNVAKATRIWNGEHPLDVLSGQKVTSFYNTIVDPKGDYAPVIDRHAFDIAVGRQTHNTARRILERKGQYVLFGNVFREAAWMVGISPAEMQAITWLAWRTRLGVSWYG